MVYSVLTHTYKEYKDENIKNSKETSKLFNKVVFSVFSAAKMKLLMLTHHLRLQREMHLSYRLHNQRVFLFDLNWFVEKKTLKNFYSYIFMKDITERFDALFYFMIYVCKIAINV